MHLEITFKVSIRVYLTDRDLQISQKPAKAIPTETTKLSIPPFPNADRILAVAFENRGGIDENWGE